MQEIIKLAIIFVLVGCSTTKISLSDNSKKSSKELGVVSLDINRRLNKKVKLVKDQNNQLLNKIEKVTNDQDQLIGKVVEPPKFLKKIYIIDMTNDKKKLETTHTYRYDLYGYLKQMDIVVVETFGVQGQGLFKMLKKSQRLFKYNEDHQIVVEQQFKYVGKEEQKQFQIDYIYNNEGYLVKSSYSNDAGLRFRNYLYNEDSILVKVQRDMLKINYKIEMNYSYDNQGKLTGIDTCLDDDNSNTTRYVFDDNINPYTKIYPEHYAIVFPEVLSQNNILQFFEKGKKYTQKRIYSYKYDDDGYPLESVCRFYKRGELQNTLTTKFYYY